MVAFADGYRNLHSDSYCDVCANKHGCACVDAYDQAGDGHQHVHTYAYRDIFTWRMIQSHSSILPGGKIRL